MENEFYKKSILVIGDVYSKQTEGSLARIVSKARVLANELNVTVTVCMFGTHVKESFAQIQSCGADKIYYKEFSEVSEITDGLITDFSEKIIEMESPQIVLYPISIRMKSVSARLAARLKTGLTADCIDFSIDDSTNLLLQKRPAFEGSVLATIICPNALPQMATADAAAFDLLEGYEKQAELIDMDSFHFQVVQEAQIIKVDYLENELLNGGKQPKLVFGVGRGVDKDTLEKIKQLANQLDAGLVASRAIVDAGMLDYKYQVGLSGKEISCETYVAFGISGTMQHMTGLKAYKTLIAVNPDKDARIMLFANYGICDTAANVVAHMQNYIQNMR